MHDLQFAEIVAESHGDGNRWREQYRILRETLSVADSIRGALEDQNLWGVYNSIKSMG